MAVTFANIVVGEGSLTVDGTNVGATQEGASLAWEPDMVDIEVDQFGDAALVVQSKVKVSLKTTLAEATLNNLVVAWGLKAADLVTTSVKTLSIPLYSVYPQEHTVVLVGKAPNSTASVTKTRTYTTYRAIQYSGSEHALNRSENVKFPVDFRILPDGSHTGAEYGTIVDTI